PDLADILYEFVGSKARLPREEAEGIIREGFKKTLPMVVPEIVEYLLWSGFFGIVRPDNSVLYIYDVNYDSKILKSLIDRDSSEQPSYQINPAFWAGLLVSPQ